MSALVVGLHHSDTWWDYPHKDWNDHINLMDLCMVWGENARSLGPELPEELVDAALSGPDRAQGHNLGAAVLGRVGDGDGLLVDVETNVESFARLVPG